MAALPKIEVEEEASLPSSVWAQGAYVMLSLGAGNSGSRRRILVCLKMFLHNIYYINFEPEGAIDCTTGLGNKVCRFY